MISDELLAVLFVHLVQWVEFTFKIARELAASLDHLVHDLDALFVRDSRTEREAGKIATNTNASALNHLSFIFSEGRAVQAVCSHLRLVLSVRAVSVIGLNDAIEQLVELLVGAVVAGVDSDARIDVLAATEDASLEGDAGIVLLVLVLIPDLLGQVLIKEHVCALLWEQRPINQVISCLQPMSTISATLGWCWFFQCWMSPVGRSAAHRI